MYQHSNNARVVLKNLFFFVFIIMEMICGFNLRNHLVLVNVFVIGGFIFLLLGILINAYARILFKNKIEGLDSDVLLKELIAKRAQSIDDINKSKHLYDLMYILINVYYFLIWLTTCLVMAGLSILMFYHLEAIIGIIIIIPLQYSLIKYLIPRSYNQPIELRSYKFPTLYNAVKEAAKILGLKNKCSLFLSFDNNVSISKLKNNYIIYIGVNIPSLLSYREFVSVMIHELAHAINDDLKMTNRVNKLERFNKGFVPSLFINSLNYLLNYYANILLLAYSKRAEEKADLLVKDTEFSQDYINALAKITMLGDLYSFSLPRKNFYEEENPPEEYFNTMFKNFLDEYELSKDIWRKKLFDNLPRRYGTHPSFIERLRNFEKVDFIVEFSEEFNEEAKGCFKIADRHVLPSVKKAWEYNREFYYLSPKENLRDYENNNNSISLYDVAYSLISLCRYDESLEVLDKILEENPNNKHAMFKKAIILASRYNDECIPLFENIIDVYFSLSHSSFTTLIDYLSYIGNIEKRDSKTEWLDQKHKEIFELGGINLKIKKRDFSLYNLDKDTASRLKESLNLSGIKSCIFTNINYKDNQYCYAFIEARDPYNYLNLEKAEQIIQAEGIECILYPINYESCNLRIYKMLLKTKLPYLFKPKSYDYRRINAIYKERIKRPNSVSYFVLLMFLMFIGILTFPVGYVLSENRSSSSSMYYLVLTLGFSMLFTGLLLSIIEIIKEKVIIKKAYKNQSGLRTIVKSDARYNVSNINIIKKYLSTMGYENSPGDETKYVKSIYRTYAPYSEYIEVKSENGDITIEAYIQTYIFKRKLERNLKGVPMFMEKLQLKKTLAVVLDLIDAPEEIII